jgi:pSer/pThr/pTyr-binding forkhead associated (FHA) protein
VIDGQRERRDRVIRLDGKELVLGRASQGQRPGPGELLFKEPTVSRNHATLTWKPLKGGFQLVHKSKTNPTLVNGKPTKKILLAPGDRVQMGLLILELEDAPGGRTPSTGRSGRSSMTEPIMEALSKVEREHEEEQRRHRAEREEKQRQREILASPEAPAPSAPAGSRRSSRLDEALRSAPYDPQEESKKRRRSSGFGWQPPEEREPSPKDSGTELFKKKTEQDYSWSAPTQAPPPPSPEVSYEEPAQRRTIPITEHPDPKPETEMAGAPVYELVVTKGPDQGRTFALKDMVMILGQKQGNDDERDAQGVLLNDATLPSEIGMFVWQGREGAYGLLASENSMQIIEVERLEQGQRRRFRVDSHSSILLRVADEIQVGLTTLRVQKIGEPLPEPQQYKPPAPAQREYDPSTPPGRPTSLRGRSEGGFDAPPPPVRPSSPMRPEPSHQGQYEPYERPEPPHQAEPDPPSDEREVPLWAQGTIGPGGSQQQAAPPAAPSSAKPKASGKDQGDILEWGNRPNVDYLLEFLAGPMRGCQVSLTPAEMERAGRLNAGAPGTRNNEISLEGPDITNQAFYLVMEDGRFSLCNECISGLLVINRSPMKTGDRVVLMTGDVITIGTTKIRFLERDVVRCLSNYGLLAESGVTSDQDRIFPLTRQRLLIGRGKACDVRLSDLEVSRVHLGLAYGDGQFSVQHRSETNPTFLNGLSLLPGTVRKIKEGDRIRLSSLTVLRLVKR